MNEINIATFLDLLDSEDDSPLLEALRKLGSGRSTSIIGGERTSAIRWMVWLEKLIFSAVNSRFNNSTIQYSRQGLPDLRRV